MREAETAVTGNGINTQSHSSDGIWNNFSSIQHAGTVRALWDVLVKMQKSSWVNNKIKGLWLGSFYLILIIMQKKSVHLLIFFKSKPKYRC